jgi:hypothetical protein
MTVQSLLFSGTRFFVTTMGSVLGRLILLTPVRSLVLVAGLRQVDASQDVLTSVGTVAAAMHFRADAQTQAATILLRAVVRMEPRCHPYSLTSIIAASR